MVQAKLTATIDKGRLIFLNPTALSSALRGFADGEELSVTVGRRVRARSTKQNAYYWGAVLPIISQATGHTVDELHEIFKRKFLQPIIVTYRDREIKMPGSTAKLSITDFYEYVERVRAEAADMGIVIPDPELIHF